MGEIHEWKPGAKRARPGAGNAAARYGAGHDGAEGPPGGEPLDLALSRKARNDVGNAERLIARFGGDLRFVAGIGWLAWDGKRWTAKDGETLAMIRAQLTAKALTAEAAAVEEAGKFTDETVLDFQERVEKAWKWATGSGNDSKLKALLAQALPHLSAKVEQLDTNPALLNVNNGTLVLGCDEAAAQAAGWPWDGGIALKPHDRADLITRLAPLDYKPEAERPLFDKYLAEVQPKPENRAFLQRWHGYGLDGRTTEQAIALYWGKGSNGKSTLVGLVTQALGDYAATLAFQSLQFDDRKRGGEATPDIAKLPGVRFVAASEPETGVRLSESTIKTMTGGERITARDLNKPFFDFMPQFKITVSFNPRPTIRGQDDGIWRRIMLVPWKVKISKPDPALPAKIWAQEASGFLNWLLDGWRLWREGGLQPPADVRDATSSYRTDSDPVGRFLASGTTDTEGKTVQASVLFNAYVAWCKRNAETPFSNTAFGRIMGERGYEKEKIGVSFYKNIEISDETLLHGGHDANDDAGHDGAAAATRDDGAMPGDGVYE